MLAVRQSSHPWHFFVFKVGARRRSYALLRLQGNGNELFLDTSPLYREGVKISIISTLTQSIYHEDQLKEFLTGGWCLLKFLG